MFALAYLAAVRKDAIGGGGPDEPRRRTVAAHRARGQTPAVGAGQPEVIPNARISDTSAPTVPPIMASTGRSRQTMKGLCQRVKTYAAWYYRRRAPSCTGQHGDGNISNAP